MKSPSDRPAIAGVATVAGWVLFTLSVVVLTGWALDLTVLQSFVPESAGMKANSAIAMMLASVALLRRNHRDRAIFSVLASLIGALTLSEYFWNFNLGIDQLLFRDTHYFFYPGRMSQYTSIGFILLGSSLLPMNSQHSVIRRLSRVLGILTGSFGALAIVSHAYETPVAHLIHPQSNVSVPTAVGFLIGAIGVQYANPSEGVVRLLHADNEGGVMLRRLLPAGLLVTLLLGLAVRDAQQHYRWEDGFSLALVGFGVGACLVTVIVITAVDLERQDLARCESEQRFLLAAKSAPVMIWMSGIDKLCTYCSEPWLEFTGRSMEAELGNGWTEGIHPDDLKQCIATCQGAFDRRDPFQMQHRFRRHDGEYRWIFDTGVPRFDQEGAFVGYIGSCVDITERKLAEEAMADLERRVLSAQEGERARIARELHDDINQRIAVLVCELHEMDRRPSGEERRSRESIESLTEQLTRIASDIQTISHRLHSSHLEYIGLAAAAEVLCRELRTKHQVEIEFTRVGIPRSLPKDISLCLYRVLQEGLQNAIKHSGIQQFKVELLGNSSEVRLTIRDNGAGFDPTRADNQQGLGLISMRERMRLVHGEFSLESRPGQGTTIKCQVPIEDQITQRLIC